MLTEKDEFIYHEMIVHVPILQYIQPFNARILRPGHGAALFPGIDNVSQNLLRDLLPTVNTLGIGLAGIEVYDLLRDEYDIQMELGDIANVLAYISIGDRERDMERLISALVEIRRRYGRENGGMFTQEYIEPRVAVSPQGAFYAPKESLPLMETRGRICSVSPGILRQSRDLAKLLPAPQSQIPAGDIQTRQKQVGSAGGLGQIDNLPDITWVYPRPCKQNGALGGFRGSGCVSHGGRNHILCPEYGAERL